MHSKNLLLNRNAFIIFAAMKFLLAIVSFWMLCLSFIPCTDASECDVQGNTTISAVSNHQHNHKAEHCTPFCTCSCCAIAVCSHRLISFSFQKQLFKKKTYAMLPAPPCQNITFAIWQPPRLS